MIKHIKCDIFESGADIICHQVNCQGVMGSGVAKQVRERYPEVYAKYKNACDEYSTDRSAILGKVQLIDIGDKYLANLFAQEYYGYDGKCYTDYEALKKCLKTVSSCLDWGQTVAFPYLMGCHRGGGSWDIVYKMIEEVFTDKDCDVLICQYNGG